MKYDTNELVEELIRLENELGRPPTSTEMNEIGAYSSETYRNRFGSWEEAIEYTGIDYKHPLAVTEEELIDELLETFNELGRVPASSEVDDVLGYTRATYSKRFGSYKNAVEEAGLSYPNTRKIPEEDLIDELQFIAAILKDRPVKAAMDECGEYSSNTYLRRFGSWDNALEAAGLDEPVTEDTLKDKLVLDVKSVSEEIEGCVPTLADVESRSNFPIIAYMELFDSFEEVLQEAGFTTAANKKAVA